MKFLLPLVLISLTFAVGCIKDDDDNQPPVADDIRVVTAEDTPVTVNLTGSDPEGKPVTFEVVQGPTNGGISGTPPGLKYTPKDNFSGTDTFTYRSNDGEKDSAPATVTLVVTQVNDAPTANDQNVTTNEDTAKSITLSASDLEGNALTYSVLSNPGHGSLSGTAPNLTYTPDLNYNGPDAFTFKANDGSVDSATAVISITVSPVNDAPVANAQSVSADEETPKAITLTGSDVEGSSLTYTVVNLPTNGGLGGTAPNLTYTPNAEFVGSDSFTFKVNDGTVDSATATVSITVLANDFLYVVNEGVSKVSAYSINHTSGALTQVSGSPYDVGSGGSRSVEVHPNRKLLYVTNGFGNSVSAYSIAGANGQLTEKAGSPFSLAHSISGAAIHKDGTYFYMGSNGGMNAEVRAYSINTGTAALTELANSPFATTGSFIASLVLDPFSKFLYAANQFSNNVTGFSVNGGNGNLAEISGSPFSVGGFNPSQQVVDPSGKYLYVSAFSIAGGSIYGFNIDQTTGALTLITGSPFSAGGSVPGEMAITPDGKYLYALQNGSDEVYAFSINASTGALTSLSGSPFLTGDGPNSLAVEPNGKFLYVANGNSNNISAYSISSSGALGTIANSPFATASQPGNLGIRH